MTRIPSKRDKARRWFQFRLPGLIISAMVLPVLAGVFAGTFGDNVQAAAILVSLEFCLLVLLASTLAGLVALLSLVLSALQVHRDER